MMRFLFYLLVATMSLVKVSGLICQRCTHVTWKENGAGKLVISRWPQSCQEGHGAGIDMETCAAGGKHVCTFIAAEISMIYGSSRNITLGNSTVRNTTMSSVTGIAYIRGCMTEQVGCFKSLSDANRHHVASEVAQLVDRMAVSSVEVVAKKGSSCACISNGCVASPQQQQQQQQQQQHQQQKVEQKKTSSKSLIAAVMRAITAASTIQATKLTSVVMMTTATTTTTTTAATTATNNFYQTVVNHVQRISDVYRIAGEMEAPVDIIICLVVVFVVCLKMTCFRRRRRLYINVVRLSIQRQWYQPV